MNPRKKNTASGLITFHTPLPVSLLKSEECTAEVKDGISVSLCQPRSAAECTRAGEKDEASPAGPQPGTRQDWLPHASLRRLQAKMEAENQEARDIIQPLLDTENGFVKELERFLSHRDEAELRRRELQHKRWTERVWCPLQRRVEEHVSSRMSVEVKKRQTLYSHYLHHCNTKGFVFLETYDLREYNPFLLNIKWPRYCKLSASDSKDTLYLQIHESLKEKRAARSCEAGRKHKLPLSHCPLSESVASQADTLLQASSYYPASASGKTPAKDDAEGRKSSRLDTVPYHIRATATPDGRCHRSSCWLSRCGGWPQPASLHQSLPASE